MALPPFFLRVRSASLVLAGGLGLLLASASVLCAQDRVISANNTVQEGKVVNVAAGNVTLNISTPGGGTGQTIVPLAQVSRVEMTPPAAYQSGLAAYKADNWDKALADLKPLVDQFRGLPADWTQQATGLLGDLYLEKKDPARAEAAYNDFRQLYPRAPGAVVRVSVGQARVAFAKNNAAQAKQQLEPLTQAALKSPQLVTALDGAAYGQAFYLLGQIQEKEGGFQSALESYLRTVTLFYQDSAVAARAQKSADALRLAHKEIAVP